MQPTTYLKEVYESYETIILGLSFDYVRIEVYENYTTIILGLSFDYVGFYKDHVGLTWGVYKEIQGFYSVQGYVFWWLGLRFGVADLRLRVEDMGPGNHRQNLRV